jgi:hypothetical protein
MIRKLHKDDYNLLSEWIDNDPYHKGLITPEFWYSIFSVVVSDDLGPVGFIALWPDPPYMRVNIQFCSNPKRVAASFTQGFDEVGQLCLSAGAKGILFTTESPKVAAFCIKRYGFERVKDTNDYLLPIQAKVLEANV